MDAMKADQYQETSAAELKQEGKIKKDEDVIADLNNQLTESMKRS
jgi:hypothetical protein